MEGKYYVEKTVDQNSALYVGVDVHRYIHTAVCANRFEEEEGQLTFPNTKDGISSFVVWLENIADQNRTRIIGVEGANGNGRLLRNLIAPKYQEIYEVNPIYTKQRRDHGTTGDKSDPVDAKLIIEVLTRRLDRLPKVTKQDHSQSLQNLQECVGFHDDLTRSQTKLKNQLHQLFYEADLDYSQERSRAFSQKALRNWQEKLTRGKVLKGDTIQKMIIKEKISQLKMLYKTIDKADTKIEELLPKLNTNLITLPGVGIITAAKIIAATRGINRFNLDGFIKYAGIAPVEKSSGKTKKHKQNKGGNRQLNNAIYTVALTQLRCHPKAKEYFQKKISEGKSKKHAIRCLMKRVACIVYGMLRTGEDYRG